MKRLFVMLLTVSVVLTTVSLNSKAAPHAQKNMQQSKDQEETDLVYGNGGYLVKVGQKVFFHDYQKTDETYSSERHNYNPSSIDTAYPSIPLPPPKT